MLHRSSGLLQTRRYYTNLRPVGRARTQYEAHHGAEIPSSAAQVEKGESRMEVQSLHHLRVNTGSRQVDVSMPPC